MKNDLEYVHGYSAKETERLYDQAGSVKDLIHLNTVYPPGSVVLEAGCGVGVAPRGWARQCWGLLQGQNYMTWATPRSVGSQRG